MGAVERSTRDTWEANPNQKKYDLCYYGAILPWVHGDVLDIGSGTGMLDLEMAKKSDVKSILAVDKLAPYERLQDPKIEHIQRDITDGLNLDKQFDTIVSSEFIEHISEQELDKLLSEVYFLLKDGGVFVGSTPNSGTHSGNPYHIKEYSVGELEAKLKRYFPVADAEALDHCITFFKCSLS